MRAPQVLRGISRGVAAAAAASFLPSPGEDLRVARVTIDGREELRVIGRYRMSARHADRFCGLVRTLLYAGLGGGAGAACGYLLPSADVADLAIQGAAIGAALVTAGNLASGVILGLAAEAGQPGAEASLLALYEDVDAVQ